MVADAVDAGQTGLPEFGPYRIQELLGQGGMGMVHRAYDTVNERVIALKRLPASVTDQEFRARFRREARIVAELTHPNVIPVNDFGEIDGQLFLDMKLVEGTDLRRMLGAGTIDAQRAIAILKQVAQALQAAHETGLVHRDVKPSNILIDTGGHAYLADFGIARATSPDATVLTSSGDLVGSWDYMAPERLSGGQVDGRSDEYSLACVLFECLTGRLPHPAVDPAAKVAAHLLQPPPAPSVFVPTITPALDEVIMRGMAKDPARRFPTPVEFMAAAESAAYSGNTRRAAKPTMVGPSKERDQGRIVRAILRSTAVRTPTRKMPHDYPPTCPYPGLRGFERGDADAFFGRDHVVTDLLVRLAEQLDTGEPVVLVGASGAGKSSVLRAGLLPALASVDTQDEAWPQIVLTPGRDPISNLATALAAHTSIVAAEWARLIRETPDRLGALIARTIGGDPIRPVIVVDQFEELFTHGIADADRIAFATALANARPALVLLAVRGDLVERCIELTPLRPALNSPVLLGPMDSTALRQAIVQPARDAGVEVEPGLAERLLADLGVRGDVGYDPGALPRLAHALRETWNHGNGNTLSVSAYRAAGGIDGAVARTAEEIYAWLDPPSRQALRTIMLRLVNVLDDGSAARRRVDPQEFAALRAHPGVMDRLIAARLVIVDGTGARLSHEALLTAWPRLRDWIDEDRAGLVQHRRLGEAVKAWTESGGHDDHLYRGTRLATVNSWLESVRDRVRLQPAEQEFLARSNAAEYAGQLATRRRTRRLRILVTALSILLVVASVAVVVAIELRQNALDESNRADAEAKQNLSRQLAAESTLVRSINPRRAALAALAAWQASPTVEARSAILSAEADHYRGRLNGHTGTVTSVAISADGRVAASGAQDGTLRLWDVPGRREIATIGEKGGWYRTVSMSADGRLLAASNLETRRVTLWSVPDRKLLFTVPGEAVDTVLSADGSLLASLSGEVTLWDTRTLAEVRRFRVGTSVFLAFSADRAMLATTNGYNAEVYRVGDGTKIATLAGHTNDVTSTAFNPAGTLLASSSQDGTVRLWDTTTWTQVRELAMAASAPNTVKFSPDGRQVVAAGAGTDLYAWDPATGDAVVLLPTGNTTTLGLAIGGNGHTLLTTTAEGPLTVWTFASIVLGTRDAAVTGTNFHPDGELLATATGTGAVRLWDSSTGDLVKTLTGHEAGVFDAAFNPDGSRLLTTSEDGVAILWEVATGAEVARYRRTGSQLTAAAFSPDGTMAAVAGHAPVGSREDRDEVLLLNASDLSLMTRRPTRQEPRNMPQDTESNYPTAVAFSPDGRTLAMSLAGGRIALWSMVDRGAPFTILPGHDNIVLDVAFSPDGTILASGGGDRQARLWRVRDGQRIGEFGHDAAVRRVVFSPDGTTLVTGSQDTVVRTWDMRTREPLTRLDRHGDVINDVDIDRSGKLVASASADGAARLWNIDVERATRVVCGLLDRETLAEEWNALGTDRGAPPTCPN